VKTRILLPLLALSMPLAGCISFGAKPPEQLLTLTSAQAAPVGQTQSVASARPATVAVPVVPQSLATQRVPVQSGPTAIAYVKDALWTEAPARQFARLVSDALTVRAGRLVLGTQTVADPGARLGGELRQFGMDAAQRQAVVTFDASLLRDQVPGSTAPAAVEKRRFEARVPVSEISAETVGPALNAAANQVAAQVADWVGR